MKKHIRRYNNEGSTSDNIECTSAAKPTAADIALLKSLDEADDAIDRGEFVTLNEFIELLKREGYDI